MLSQKNEVVCQDLRVETLNKYRHSPTCWRVSVV